MGLVGLQAFAAVIALALGVTVGPETDDTATLTGAESTTTNPAPAAADDEAAPSFEGNFRFSGGKKQRQGVIDAVERAVQALLPVFHDLARERLGKANRVPNRIVMERDGNDIVVTYGDLAPMRARAVLEQEKALPRSEHGPAVAHVAPGELHVQPLEGGGVPGPPV